MEVLVDDQAYEITGPDDQTIAELANEVCNAKGHAGQRMVVGLRCDGQTVSNDKLTAVLQTPAGRFQRLELQTQPVAALVRATLTQALEVFEDSAASRHRVADLLDEGRHDAAMQQLQKFLNAWKQVQQCLVLSAQALEADLEAVRVNDLPLGQILDLIKTQLTGLKDAMETGDFVVVGDILRYEFDEPLAHWVALLKHLRQLAETAPSGPNPP